MVKNLKSEWLNYPALVKRQIDLCNEEYKEYKKLYAAFIPHLIVGVEKYTELEIEKCEIF